MIDVRIEVPENTPIARLEGLFAEIQRQGLNFSITKRTARLEKERGTSPLCVPSATFRGDSIDD
jgi:hypothetical protein